MANFMGPMAPPQAAQPQPAQLDVKTNPSQRAQFKSFMQGMSVPPTTAPIAPMLPAPMPSPMDQVDIFAPAPMADGGVVGGLNKLGEMSGQMVEALDTVVYGGGQGGGFSGGMSSGGGFGGGNMPPPLPMTQIGIGPFKGGVQADPFPTRSSLYETEIQPATPLSLNDSASLGLPTPQYMPFDPDGDGMDQQGRPMESQLSDEQLEAMKAQMMGLRSSAGNQGSAFGAGSMGSPFARLAGLGSVFGYEDGGAVKMARGTTNVLDGTRSGGNNIMPLYDESEDPSDGRVFQISPSDSTLPSVGLSQFYAPGNMKQPPSNLQNVMNFADNIMDGAQMQGPLGGTFNIRPTMRGDDLGIMASYNLSFANGGPVRMANGGGVDYSMEGIEEAMRDAGFSSAADPFADYVEPDEDPGENAGIDMGNPDPDPDPVVVQNIGTGDEGSASITVRPTVSDTVYTPPTSTGAPVGNVYPYTDNDDFQRQVQEFQRRSLTDPVVTSDRSIDPITTPNYGTQRDKNYGMDIFDLLSGDLLSDSVPPTGPGGDEPLFTPAPASPPIIDRNADPDALSPAEELAIARGNPPTPGPYTGSGDSSVLLTGQDGDTTGEIYTPELQLANLAKLRITGTGNEKIDGRSVIDDLNKRTAGADAGFSPAGILAKALGGGMATKIEKNVLSGDPDVFPVIDSSTNQIIGYSGKGGRGYTGRPGYNPITAGLFDNTSDRVRYDAATGSYFVDPLPAGYDSPDPQDEEMHRLRAAQAADQTQPPAAPPPPNMITRPDNPVTPAPPPDVVVPSPRDPVNIGGAPVLTSPLLTAPNIDPVQSVGLPQSFLDLLAQLNRPSPRPSPRDLPRDGPVAFQDGGAVLDKAAGDFLEALRVA